MVLLFVGKTILYLIGGLIAYIGIILGISYGIKALVNIKNRDKIIEENRNNPEMQPAYIKKYPEADLRNFSKMAFLVGMIFALTTVIFAFTFTPSDKGPQDLGTYLEEEDFEIEPPQTQQKPPPPPPPPPPEIEIVEDEEVLEEEPEIEDIEVEEDEIIEAPIIEEEEPAEPDFFTIVEDMPAFKGCENVKNKDERKKCTDLEIQKYLAKIRYPPQAKELEIEGTVIIRFLVDKTGEVAEATLVRGPDKILNDAALQHVKNMPRWTPGKQRGKPVRVQYIVPIKFRLQY
ncbi:MAG: energy transducer TonB [Chitinophagales bacterium]|nr:energy transducer TonB [Chitinophagales bacterium]